MSKCISVNVALANEIGMIEATILPRLAQLIDGSDENQTIQTKAGERWLECPAYYLGIAFPFLRPDELIEAFNYLGHQKIIKQDWFRDDNEYFAHWMTITDKGRQLLQDSTADCDRLSEATSEEIKGSVT